MINGSSKIDLMRTVSINFILLCLLSLCGPAYAESEEVVSGNGNIEQAEPVLQGDPFLQAEYLFHS